MNGLSQIAERFWRFQCHEFPLAAVAAGERTVDAILFRESLDDYDRRRHVAVAMLAELNSLSDAGVPKDRATSQLLRRELQDIVDFYDVGAHVTPPMFPFGPEFAAVHFGNTASIADAAAAECYCDRLATLPSFIDDVRTSLLAGYETGARYPRAVLDQAIANLRAAIAGQVAALAWYSPFQRSGASRNDALQRQSDRALALIKDRLVPRFAAHADFLEMTLRNGARETLSCADTPRGRELYRVMVRHYTTTDMDPEQIHRLGTSEVERLLAEMEAVAADAGFKGEVIAYRRFLSTDPQFLASSKEALRERFEIQTKRIDKRIPIFFGRLPRMTYGVESIPEAMSASMPSAYAQANPADGTASGTFWVTSLPQRSPTYMHLALALHEAWPGHLMHLALMQEMNGVPAFLRHGSMKYSAYLEGWALYCEGLGVDMGLYETPHQHYGRLDMELWRALRLVVDTGIHWYGWSRERAVECMAQHLALPRASIEAEVTRYIALPAQALAYQIGNLKFRELRRRAETTLGDRFSLRAFHDAVTSTGLVTLPVLDDLIQGWLDGHARGQAPPCDVS